MAKKKTGLRTYQRLLMLAKKYWPLFLIGVTATIVVSLVDALFAYLVKPIIDKGFIHRDVAFIRWLPLFIVLIFVFRGLCGFMSSYSISRLACSIVRDLRRKVFSHLLLLPAKFYNKNNSGQLLALITYNISQVASASSTALLTILRETTLLISLVVVMLVVSWQLFILFALLVPLMFLVIRWSSRRLRRLSDTLQQSVADVTHIADEVISSYQVVRLFGGQQHEKQKFHTATRNNWRRDIKVVITNSIGTSLVQLSIALLIAGVLIFATMPSLGITAGAFGTIVTCVIMLLRPARRLTTVNSDIQKGIIGAASVFELLDRDAEIDTGTQQCGRATGEITFDHATFAYESHLSPAVNQIDFKVKPGQTIAIVGHSGAGKSTLINLLPRFYELSQGSIQIDDVDIRDYKLMDLRNQFALVSQNPSLFNDTVAHNIAYGSQGEASQQEIIDAAKDAYAWEFITELEHGLDTIIGEDGVMLSGGQRQRLAIARALLKKAPILILDEATSALDTHSERQIQQALTRLIQQSTTLVIAHRLSTIEHADWILVMDKGQLAEQGTHSMLLKQGGLYAELHRLQFKERSSEAEKTHVPA